MRSITLTKFDVCRLPPIQSNVLKSVNSWSITIKMNAIARKFTN